MNFPSNISLNVNGRNGFKTDGNNFSSARNTLDFVGDINNDGIDDLAIFNYVVFGRNTGFEEDVDLEALDGSNGFELGEPVASGSSTSLGIDSISAAGDFNGDGINDLIVGVGRDGVNSAYVLFGRSDGFAAQESLTNLAAADGIVIEVPAGDQPPIVGEAGDINNDGFDDIVIGTENKSYVVFGRSTGLGADFNLDALDGSNGFVFDRPGVQVGTAGDFDGDGIDDLLIGDPEANPDASGQGRGEAYVILGRDTGFNATVTRADLDAGDGFIVKGFDPGSGTASALSKAGDINGDGFDDVVIGAPGTGSTTYPNSRFGTITRSPGAAYVVFGRESDSAPGIELSELDGSDGFLFRGQERTGTDVSDAGDVNSDGIDDLLVSTGNQFFTGFSSSYVVFGTGTGFAAELIPNLNSPPADRFGGSVNVALIEESNSPPRSGGNVEGGGDINGDGVSDIVVATSSTSYVIFGKGDTPSEAPAVNGISANIYVNDDNVIVGDAFNAGEPYQGFLLSNTDGSINPSDVIVGTSGNDNIWSGTQGNDDIAGGDGDDIIGFGAGDAFVEAGAGDDFVYATGAGAGSNNIDLGDGNDNFYALAGNNRVRGSGNNTIAIGSGNDDIITGDGDDFVYSVGEADTSGRSRLSLGDGNNTVWLQTGNYENIFTGAGDDIVGLGNGEHRNVSLGDGNDIVYMANSAAAEGDSNIRGGVGDDYIQLGAGDDVLEGGVGFNTLFGGAGSDIFKVDLDGYAFIGDFELGIDQLQKVVPFGQDDDLIGTDGITYSQGSLTGDRTENVFVYGDDGSNIAEIAGLTVDALLG